jgi:polyisoprenoid-binding protein YceI
MSTISTTPLAPAGTWAADPVHSNVSFEVGYAGVNTFRGGFKEFTAVLSGDSLTGSAKVASVDVKDEQLNGHLQTPDFFDAERFPELTFEATELTKGEDGTIAGRIAGAPATDPFGRERLGLRLEATIDRNEYGVSWNAPNQSGGNYLADDVALVAELALVRQEG